LSICIAPVRAWLAYNISKAGFENDAGPTAVSEVHPKEIARYRPRSTAGGPSTLDIAQHTSSVKSFNVLLEVCADEWWK
jgi:hypothetical protein